MEVFDAKKAKESIVNDIREWFDKNFKGGNAVIGISGGKDSTIVAALCVEAIGKDRVIGVQMPNGVQHDIEDSDKVFEVLGIKKITINIEDCFKSLTNQISNYSHVSQQTIYNLPPRLRMTTLFAVAQSMNGVVINTSNLSEYMLGWFTFGSDTCGSYAPIMDYTCTEVIKIGEELTQIPLNLVDKVPSDGLIGLSDEQKFGFTYKTFDEWFRGRGDIDDETFAIIDNMMAKSNFKRQKISRSRHYTKKIK